MRRYAILGICECIKVNVMKGGGDNGILRIPLLGVGSFCNPAGFLRSFLVRSISENILYPCLSLIKFFFIKVIQ